MDSTYQAAVTANPPSERERASLRSPFRDQVNIHATTKAIARASDIICRAVSSTCNVSFNMNYSMVKRPSMHQQSALLGPFCQVRNITQRLTVILRDGLQLLAKMAWMALVT